MVSLAAGAPTRVGPRGPLPLPILHASYARERALLWSAKTYVVSASFRNQCGVAIWLDCIYVPPAFQLGKYGSIYTTAK